MPQLLEREAPRRGMHVDKERGIIRNVKIVGHNSKNGRQYTPAALRSAAPLYEGASVNLNHAKTSPRGYEDRVGTIRNVHYVEGSGLYGDLHFNPMHPIANQLVYDAEFAPERVGLSHNVHGRSSRKDGKDIVE